MYTHRARGRTRAQDEREMDNETALIQRISITAGGTVTTLDVAYPRTPAEHGVINVVCGPNGSGKTRLLNQIDAVLVPCKRNTRVDTTTISVASTAPTVAWERCFLISEHTVKKSRVGHVGMSKEIELEGPVHDRFVFTFLYQCFKQSLGADLSCSLDDWIANSARSKLVRSMRSDTALYRCPPSHSLVRDIEALFGAGLFFRYERIKDKSDQIVLYLVFATEEALPFPQWSDGQQAAFYLLLFVHSRQPNVLLIDELENHLHPSFMTSVLGSLQQTVRQTIIATHHPHIIFSRYADRVLYLEHVGPPTTLGGLPTGKLDVSMKPLSRALVVRALPDAFEKLDHVYKLFDLRDSQLLQQAQLVRHEAELRFYKEFLAITREPDVLPAAPGRLPDRQTEQVASLLAMLGRTRETDPGTVQTVRVLDVGSGIGRVILEMSKYSEWQTAKHINWACTEPKQERRDALQEKLARCGLIAAEVHADMTELLSGAFDAVLLCNVVHELPAQSLSDVLATVRPLLRPESGRLIIAEIYPLLHPEKFAVAYSEDALRRVLSECGYFSQSTMFSVRQSAVYCVRGTPRADVCPTKDEIEERIFREWDQIERSALESYSALEGMSSVEDFSRAIQYLTSIASIRAARSGVWH